MKVMIMKNQDFQAIYDTAIAAGNKAYNDYLEKHGEPMYCGFAWAELPSARTPFVNWCKKNGVGSKHWRKGWTIWNPCGHGTQSMDLKEVATLAFVEVLRENGIDCYMGSRAD